MIPRPESSKVRQPFRTPRRPIRRGLEWLCPTSASLSEPAGHSVNANSKNQLWSLYNFMAFAYLRSPSVAHTGDHSGIRHGHEATFGILFFFGYKTAICILISQFIHRLCRRQNYVFGHRVSVQVAWDRLNPRTRDSELQIWEVATSETILQPFDRLRSLKAELR